MALFNPATITVSYAKRLIDRDPDRIALIQNDVDIDVNAAVLWTGLKKSDIPVDGDGFTTSDVLIRFARYRFLHYVCTALRGSTSIDDVYQRDAVIFDEKSDEARQSITDCTILENETNAASDRMSSAVVY